MTEYTIYLNGRPVTTIGLSCFQGCDEEAIATRHAQRIFHSNKVRAVPVRKAKGEADGYQPSYPAARSRRWHL